uniref:Predicted nucleoside-diphosphate-sugar epimerases n=1 Tax=uncultured SAR11 cluster bacterium HF0770_37D02 TaxID=710726 RepID=E0XYV2_9PROT|nr:predicted nucleoside-diphosphate-sugar epimerases [uncultured SAR11 cluster bacterium HF0770_37D02]
MRQLTRLDYRIKVATRHPYLKGYLKPLGNPGQIELFRTNIFNSEDVKQVIKNCDLVINLVGVLYETRKQKFNQIHVQFPNLLSELCNEFGVKKLVHVSALGVKEGHTSQYMQSKLQGEKNIQNIFKKSIILRPSVIFGPEDKFFNTFATIAQFSPALPLIGGGKTQFEPVYVGDVAVAIVKSLELDNSEPNIYELGGANYSFRELMQILLSEIKKKRFLIPIPFGMAKFQSYFLQMMPTPLLTPDQVEMLKYDNVVSGDHKTLKNLKIKSTTIQSILSKYIYRFRTGGQFG